VLVNDDGRCANVKRDHGRDVLVRHQQRDRTTREECAQPTELPSHSPTQVKHEMEAIGNVGSLLRGAAAQFCYARSITQTNRNDESCVAVGQE
jgi:hypothetical protein